MTRENIVIFPAHTLCTPLTYAVLCCSYSHEWNLLCLKKQFR